MAPIAVTATATVARVLTLSGAALRERLKQTKQNQKESRKKKCRYNRKSSKTRRADTYCSYRYGLRYRYGRRYRYICAAYAQINYFPLLLLRLHRFCFCFCFFVLPSPRRNGVGSWQRSWGNQLLFGLIKSCCTAGLLHGFNEIALVWAAASQ